MGFEGCGDVAVSLFFAGPAALFGVGLQSLDVGELVGQGGRELGAGV